MNVAATAASVLADLGLADVSDAGVVSMSEASRRLQFDMNLQQKAINRIKMNGGVAEAMLDEMFAQID